MSEKTKQKENNGKRAGKQTGNLSVEENEKPGKQGNWSEDQQEKSYYYDDAHGYEIYNPNEDDDLPAAVEIQRENE